MPYKHAITEGPILKDCLAELDRLSLEGWECYHIWSATIPAAPMPLNLHFSQPLAIQQGPVVHHYFLLRKEVGDN